MVTVLVFLLMMEVRSPNIPYVLTTMFYAVKAAKDLTIKYIESGVALAIAVKPPILKPPVIIKHLITNESSEDFTKLVLTLQCAPLLDVIFAVSNVIWI